MSPTAQWVEDNIKSKCSVVMIEIDQTWSQ